MSGFTRTGLMQCSKTVSLDHLVGAGEQSWRHVEAQRLGGFEIDHQLVSRRRLYWKLGHVGTLEDAIDIRRRLPVHVDTINPVGYESAIHGKETVRVNRGQAVPCC